MRHADEALETKFPDKMEFAGCDRRGGGGGRLCGLPEPAGLDMCGLVGRRAGECGGVYSAGVCKLQHRGI